MSSTIQLAAEIYQRRKHIIRIIGEKSYNEKIGLFKMILTYEMAEKKTDNPFEVIAGLAESPDFVGKGEITIGMLFCGALEIIESNNK